VVLCASPLCDSGGIRGKKCTRNIGWEVSVRSSWSESGKQEGAQAQNNNLELFVSIYGNPKLRFYS
jgi:hypothetical protein